MRQPLFQNNDMLQRMNLTFLGSLTSCSHSVLMASAKLKKRKNALLSGALLSFCVVCEIFLCTSFQTFLRRDFVTVLYRVSFFCHQAICTHSLLHPQPNILIWKMLWHIWCADTNDLHFISFFFISLHIFYEDCRKVKYILVKAALLRGYRYQVR